jgi:hypothetical protein
MRLIGDLMLENENLKFKFKNGQTCFLFNYSHLEEKEKFTNIRDSYEISKDIYLKFGKGKLLENNEILEYYIINKIGTNQEFIISTHDFNLNMKKY